MPGFPPGRKGGSKRPSSTSRCAMSRAALQLMTSSTHTHSRSLHYRATLALLTAAGISLALMQTLVIPALPLFQREFDASAGKVTWLVTSFLVSSSVLTPIIGKLGDAHGKKRLLVITLALFGVASLGAASAWNIESLVAFRAL